MLLTKIDVMVRIDRLINITIDIYIYIQRYTERDRQINIIDRQTDSQTDRQTDRQIYRYSGMPKSEQTIVRTEEKKRKKKNINKISLLEKS